MPDEIVQPASSLLEEAIERRAPVIIWFRVDGAVRHLTSRFLGRQAAGIWIETPEIDPILIQQLIDGRAEIAVAYKSAENSDRFVARLVARDQAAIADTAVPLDGLLLQRSIDKPDAHRRQDFRVAARDSRLAIKLWRIADHVYFRDRPTAAQRLESRVIDLSVGGLGVLMDVPAEPLEINQRLRIEMKYDDADLLMEGMIRHTSMRKHGRCVRVGIQFKKLENDVVWRQEIAALTKIVGDIQRTEVRRSREAADAIQSLPLPPTAA